MLSHSNLGDLRVIMHAQNRFLALYADAIVPPLDEKKIEAAIQSGYGLSRQLHSYRQALEAAWDAGRVQVGGIPTYMLEHEVGVAIRATHSRLANLIILAGRHGED